MKLNIYILCTFTISMKTIGVLGGLGPQATIDFYSKVLSYCQTKIKAHANEGYPPMIIYNCNFPPFSERNKSAVNLRLIAAAKSLEKAGANFIVIPSVTPHIFYDDIKSTLSIPVVNVINEVINIAKHKSKIIGLLGTTATIKSTLFQSHLEKYGIKTLTLNESEQTQLEKIIFSVMEGGINPEKRKVVIKAINKLKKSGASLIILGCTELPVLLGSLSKREEFLDTIDIAAKVSVEKAMKA